MQQLCERMALGELVKDVSKELGIPRNAPFRWGRDDVEIKAMYEQARDEQARALAEDMVAIANGTDGLSITYQRIIAGEADGHLRARMDNAAVQRDKLRVETLRFIVSRHAPATYGDRIEHVGRVTGHAVVVLPPLEPLPPVAEMRRLEAIGDGMGILGAGDNGTDQGGA